MASYIEPLLTPTRRAAEPVKKTGIPARWVDLLLRIGHRASGNRSSRTRDLPLNPPVTTRVPERMQLLTLQLDPASELPLDAQFWRNLP